MFKRMFTMIVVVVMTMSSFALTANAACQPEITQPDFIGMEHLDAVMELDERWRNDEIEPDYHVEMSTMGGYWVVYMYGEAEAYDGYYAMGLYDHTPTDEEMDVLWASRMLEEDFDELLEKYGI